MFCYPLQFLQVICLSSFIIEYASIYLKYCIVVALRSVPKKVTAESIKKFAYRMQHTKNASTWRHVISLFQRFMVYNFVLLCKLIKLFVKVNWIRESSDCSCPDCINRVGNYSAILLSLVNKDRTQSGSQSFLNAFCWRRRVFSED